MQCNAIEPKILKDGAILIRNITKLKEYPTWPYIENNEFSMTFLGINDAIETGKKLISSRFNHSSRYYIASAYQTVADTKNNYFYSFL